MVLTSTCRWNTVAWPALECQARTLEDCMMWGRTGDVERREGSQLVQVPEAVDEGVRDALLPAAVRRGRLPRPEPPTHAMRLGKLRQRRGAGVRVVKALRAEVGGVEVLRVQLGPAAERVHVEGEVIDMVALGQALLEEGAQPRQPFLLVLRRAVGVRPNQPGPCRRGGAGPELIQQGGEGGKVVGLGLGARGAVQARVQLLHSRSQPVAIETNAAEQTLTLPSSRPQMARGGF